MDEKLTERKRVVKKIAVIFFAVLILLTFFSNTIMNYYLPEVTVQYMVSGNINNQIRDTGIVERGSLKDDKSAYILKLWVSKEQASWVKTGDLAELLNAWDEDVKAKLVKISRKKTEEETRELLFSVTGKDVEEGKMLELLVGNACEYYDTIVTNSAIHEDNGGTFVLAIEAKSSPLGNRYYAKRIDISILASDMMYSAVTGDMKQNECIILNGSKPIEPGMQIQLAKEDAI